MSKKEPPKKIRYCVVICEPLNNDYQSASPFSDVGNYPAIDYTLNWLSQNGLQEAFLFYSTLKAEIEQYSEVYAKNIDLKLRLNYMKPSKLRNFGDVMREVRFRDLISQDFIVIYADTVANVDLTKMVNTHFNKKNELRNVVLTTAMRRGVSEELMVLNLNTGEILQLEENGKDLAINCEKVSLKKINVEVRNDLVQADLFVCTLDLLKSFKETEEYQTMHDFIFGMLTSEVYEEKIIVYELKNNQIALRVNRAATTYLAHMNFISGYLSPYSLYGEDRLAKMHRNCDKMFTSAKFHKIYRKGVKVHQSAKLSNIVYLGQGVNIEEGSFIQKSIIGKEVFVGKNSSIKTCVVLSGVKLQQNSRFEHCLIEKAGTTVNIRNFKAQVFAPSISLIQGDLFEESEGEESPEHFNEEEISFETEVKAVAQNPDEDQILVVNDLNGIKAKFSKSKNQLTKQIIKVLAPQGVKDIQSFAEDWGQILFKIHSGDQQELMESLLFTCSDLQPYQKAYHLFLQCFYHYDALEKEAIIKWIKIKTNDSPENETLAKCLPFIEKLEEESEDEDDEEDE